METCKDCLHQCYAESIEEPCNFFIDKNKYVEVVRCKDCVYDGMHDCTLCYIENHTLQFINHDPDFYCAKGEQEDKRCD